MGVEGDAGGPDPRLQFVYEEAVRALDRQAVRLDDLRGRSATLLGAGSIAGGVLAAESFSGGSGATTWAWIATIAFVLMGLLTAWVLSPSEWRFTRDAARLHAEWVEPGHSMDTMYRHLARYLAEDYLCNDRKLGKRAYALSAIVLLLVAQLLAQFVDLTQRV